MVVHGQVHAAAGDAGLVREDGQRGLVLAVVPPVRARRRDACVEIKFRRPRLSANLWYLLCIHKYLARRLWEVKFSALGFGIVA